MSANNVSHENIVVDGVIDFTKSLSVWQKSVDAYEPTKKLLEAMTKLEDNLKATLELCKEQQVDASELSTALSSLVLKKTTLITDKASEKIAYERANSCISGNRQDSEVYEGLSAVTQQIAFHNVWLALTSKSFSFDVSKSLKDLEINGLNPNLSLRSSIRQQNNQDGKAEKLVRLDVQSKKLVVSIYAVNSGIVQRFTVDASGMTTQELLVVARGKNTSITTIHSGEPKAFEDVKGSILKLI